MNPPSKNCAANPNFLDFRLFNAFKIIIFFRMLHQRWYQRLDPLQVDLFPIKELPEVIVGPRPFKTIISSSHLQPRPSNAMHLEEWRKKNNYNLGKLFLSVDTRQAIFNI